MGNQRINCAISIRQPYAEKILRGTKVREYRSVRTRKRERVWIYASLKPADNEIDRRRVDRDPARYPTGRIVGSIEIVDCEERGKRDFAYRLARPRRIAKIMRHKNQPQPVFWRPTF